MPIQWDTRDDSLWLQGERIGGISAVDAEGKVTVTLSFHYSCAASEAHAPLIALAVALSELPQFTQTRLEPDLVISLPEGSIGETYDVPRLLGEKQVKAGGFVWEFHKSDADPWPSQLHGHEYEHNLKLDALTGDIYDPGTRNKCMRLKPKDLAIVHLQLRGSKDFSEKIEALLKDKP